jgi:uncharacterized protein YxjI
MRKILLVVAVLLGFVLPAMGQQAPIRINCGGSSYTDSKGQIWQADSFYNSGTAYSATTTVKNTSDQPLYRTERWNSNGASIVYTIPVANGVYHVNLLFAENYAPLDAVGARVFNVKMQGNVVLPNLDIFAAAGASAALVKSADVTVQNGKLTIEFVNVVQYAKVNAIEILPATQAAAPPKLTLNFLYPDGTPVSGTLSYTLTSSVLNLQGSSPLTNGQATCVLYTSPAQMGLSVQFQANLSLKDTAGHQLWQVTVALNPSQVDFGAVQSSSLNVVVQRL